MLLLLLFAFLRLRERRQVNQKDHPRSQRAERAPSQAVLPKAAVMEMTTCFRCETVELICEADNCKKSGQE